MWYDCTILFFCRPTKQRKWNHTSTLGLPKSFLITATVNFKQHSSDLGSFTVGTHQMKSPTGVIVGTGHHNATKLLRFLEEWVNSEPVLQVEKLGLWFSTKCPVKISSLSAPQCPSFRQPPAGGAQCGNVCTCTVRGEHLQTSTAVPKDEGSA